jgi:tripartite ATP-independent transporter DctM subunit
MISPELLCLAMFASVCVALLAGFPVAFTLAGVATAFAFLAHALGVFDLALLNAIPSRLYALMIREPLVAVPLFVVMGVTLERSGVAHELLACMGGLLRAAPGGLAISVSLVGMLLAASTGIVGATVVTLGLLSLPAMLGRGYDPAFATGTVAAAGTLGQIIPPSIVLIFLGDQLSIAYQRAQYAAGNAAPDSISINDLFAGALLPGLLLVGFYVVYQMAYAHLRPERAPRDDGAAVAAGQVIGIADLAATLLAPLALIVAVLGSILAGVATATEAASVGAVGALLLAAQRLAPARTFGIAAAGLLGLVVLRSLFDLRPQREVIPAGDWIAIAAALALCAVALWGLARAVLGLHAARNEAGAGVLQDIVRASLKLTSMIFAIVIGASLFALVFRGLGGAKMIEGFLGDLPGGTMTAMLVVVAVMFLLGFFLDFLEIVFVVVPVVAPVLLQMEIAPGEPMNPIWLGIMMAIVLQTSFLTPPFGFALFYLRGVAPDEVRTLDIYRGVAPFVVIQLTALAVVWSIPAIATWLPAALYGR